MPRQKEKRLGICAKIKKKGENYLAFQISGHAGYAVKGKDIICSAVSMITIQTVNAIETFTTSKAEIEERDGYLNYQLINSTPEAQLLLKAYVLGLEMILEEYGNEYIDIEYKEV